MSVSRVKALPENIELIIFDCDGVLVDSEAMIRMAHHKMLAAHGVEVSASALMRDFAGLRGEEIAREVEKMFQVRLPPSYPETVRQWLFEAYPSQLRAMNGAHQVLSRIRQTCCVASNAPMRLLDRALTSVGMAASFQDRLFSADDVASGKPSPEIFHYSADQMGVHVSRCLVVEDSVAGVKGALAAGMAAVGFVGGRHCSRETAGQLLDVGAVTVFDELAFLSSLLGA
ncbi:MAG: HAD-IA family hydrolase [Pseudomonadota bacterium]